MKRLDIKLSQDFWVITFWLYYLLLKKSEETSLQGCTGLIWVGRGFMQVDFGFGFACVQRKKLRGSRSWQRKKLCFIKMEMAPLCQKWNCSCTMHLMFVLKLPTSVKTFNSGVRKKFEACKAKIMQSRLGFEFLFFMKWLEIKVINHQLHLFDSPYSRMISRIYWTFWKAWNVIYNPSFNWFWIFPL